MTEGQKWSRAKLAGIVATFLAVIVIAIQNTESVETRILFASVTMPRVVLLVIMLFIGFGCGFLSGYRLRSRADRGTES